MVKIFVRFAAKVLVLAGPSALLVKKGWAVEGIVWFVAALVIYVLYLLKREGVSRASPWWAAGACLLIPLLASASIIESDGPRIGPFTLVSTRLSMSWLAFVAAAVLCTTFYVAMLAYFADYVFVSQGAPSLVQVMRFLFLGMHGWAGSYSVIDDGQETELKPMGPMASKGKSGKVLVIQNEQAVVLERAGDKPRVARPGVVFTRPFERVRKVILTRRQFAPGELKDALTKDGVFLSFGFSILYQITGQPDAGPDSTANGSYTDEVVLRATFNTFDVKTAIVAVAQNLLRDKIARYYLDDLYDPLRPATFPLGQIKQEVRDELAPIAANWGVGVRGFNITSVAVPDQVREQMLEQWRIEWAKRAMATKAEAEADYNEALKLANIRSESALLRIMAQFFRDAGLAGSANDVVKLRFAEALERLVADPMAQQKLAESIRAMRGMDHFARDVQQEDFFA